jgi:hypothetical protein
MTIVQISATLLLIGLLGFGNCNGQTKSEAEKVVQFKDDFLSKKGMYKPDTLQISTAMLTRERYPNVRCITTYPKDKKIKQVEYYYNDTKILESNIAYKLPSGHPTGITKHYDEKGKLEYIQDHDKGTWEVVKFDNFPYYATLVKMKKLADSLIIFSYGQSFFDNYVVWSTEGSAFYNGKGAGATWYDYQEWRPKEFLLRYSIKLSEDEIYNEQFEVHLDSAGKIFFPFNYDDIKGFEKITTKNGVVLTKQSAIDKAKQLGLVENDTTKAFTFLIWQFNEGEKLELFNGHFTYKVAVNTKTIKHEPKGGRNRIEYKFDVYVFNPWTGQFIEKQRMKSYREWEKLSGQTTGLMPDK